MARTQRSKADPASREPATDAAEASGLSGVSSRRESYLIAPSVPPHDGGQAAARLAQRMAGLADVEVIEVLTPPAHQADAAPHAERRAVDPGAAHAVVIARMTPRRAETLREESAGQILIEADLPLTCSTLNAAAGGWECHDPGVAMPHGAGFSTSITVRGGDAPVAGAVVQLFGRIWSASGITDEDGQVALTIYGEAPDSITGLLVQPRADYWSRWIRQPALAPDRNHAVELRPLAQPFPEPSRNGTVGWGQRAMGLDLLPASWRGQGVKVALIDSGVAATHRQLRGITHGVDVVGKSERGWQSDQTGHGSHCAGIIAARADESPAGGLAIRGFAPDAELHVCRIFPGGRLSDLIRALNYCLAHGIELVHLGAGTPQGSQIVERQIVLAKQRGIACIAAAGNSAGVVEYPAASAHVLAVAAIGQVGVYPPDSYHATQALDGRDATRSGGVFAARFSCHGPEIDVAAPGVAVISSAPPDDFAALDGTSVAAAHVTGLAALLLAHHPDFHGSYAAPGAARVERLFQILKATAVRLDLGDPTRTGAGLPDAAQAFNLGLPGRLGSAADSAARAWREATGAGVALIGLREAMRRAGLLEGAPEPQAEEGVEPFEIGAPAPVLRGPAITGTAPLTWTPAATNGGAAAATLAGLRAAMTDAALL